MKYFIMALLILLSSSIYSQSTIKAKRLAQVAAENLMEKVSPFSGHHAIAQIHDAEYDSRTGKYEIEMTASWEGSPCFLCDAATFEVKGFLSVNQNGSNADFKVVSKNQAVTDAEFWNGFTNAVIALGTLILEEQSNENQSSSDNVAVQGYDESTNNQLSHKGKIYAVIVGVSQYEYGKMNLNFCDDDARSFAEVILRQTSRDNITLLTDFNANKMAILSAMRSQFLKAGPNDKVIFFFSGHGNKGYLVPSDCKDNHNALYFDDLKRLLKESKAGEKYIFADACMAGSIRVEPSKAVVDHQTVGNNYTSKVMVFMSSRGSQLSNEIGALRHGVFSYFLIKGLRGGADSNRDRCISAKELYTFTSIRVKDYGGPKQIPIMWGNFENEMSVLCW